MMHRDLALLLLCACLGSACVQVDRTDPAAGPAGVDASSDGATADGIVDAPGVGDTPLLTDGDVGDTSVLTDGDGDGAPEVLPDADVAGEVLSDVEVVTPPDADGETLGDAGDTDGDGAEVSDGDVTVDAEVVESSCIEGDACQGEEPCQLGMCVGGECVLSNEVEGPLCDDGFDCTSEETCDVEGACVGSLDHAFCDDGNPCTASVCVAVGDLDCVTESLENGTFCSDGDLCTEVAECQEGSCVVTSAVECPVENSCTTGTCDSTSGDCVFEALEDGEDCEDGNKCTANDTCTEGVCDGAEVDCNDKNPCTTTACDAEAGCDDPEPVPEGTGCDLSNYCTENDACDVTGTCVAGPKVALTKCDDKNTCTVDDCDPTVCPCGGEDDCDPTACPCCGEDDGDPIAGSGGGACVHVNVEDSADCDDENPCTNYDLCFEGSCVGGEVEYPGMDKSQPPFCDDGEQCTTDSCQENVGCKHSNLGANATCEDGSACTVEDTCKAGTCEPGDEIECPEGSECAISSCDDDTGCVVENLSEEEPCTTADEEGACVLHRCDGEGGCGVQLAEGATGASGTFHDAKALADGGWVLAGTVASDSDDWGENCVSVVRLDLAGEVLWENSSICAGVPGDDGSRAFGLDVFEDGKVAVVGSVDTNPVTATLSPVLWIVSADGASVTTHFLADEDSSGPAQDVIVLDDDSLMVLIDHPIDAAGTLRALVQESHPQTDWDAPGVDHAWSFQQPDTLSPNEALDARRLFPVDASELRYGLVGTYSANDVIFQQAARIFDAAEGAPGDVSYISSTGEGGVLAAHDGLYWESSDGLEGYLLAGSYESPTEFLGVVQFINPQNQVFASYGTVSDQNEAMALVSEDVLLVASNMVTGMYEGHGVLRLRTFAYLDGDPPSNDESPQFITDLAEEKLGPETLLYALACHPGAACLAAGSRDGAPTWFMVDPNDKELAVCGPEAP